MSGEENVVMKGKCSCDADDIGRNVIVVKLFVEDNRNEIADRAMVFGRMIMLVDYFIAAKIVAVMEGVYLFRYRREEEDEKGEDGKMFSEMEKHM